jgi:hypothetical protein
MEASNVDEFYMRRIDWLITVGIYRAAYNDAFSSQGIRGGGRRG